MAVKKALAAIATIIGVAVAGHGVWAQSAIKAEDGQLGLQPAYSPIMEQVTDFHNLLLVIITAIVVLVITLLIWVMVRYNRRANPAPSKTSHNTVVEVIWTAIPMLILIVIAIPSFKLLYAQGEIPEADMVIQVTGHQWYWTYEYPDNGGIAFDGIMLSETLWDDPAAADDRRQARQELADFLGRDDLPEVHRLLDTNTRMVVPVDTTVKVLVTASDVLHSWAMPAFGVKMDAIPGRFNETWFRATETGTYYGQCSELCGIRHAFMPIVVEVVTREQFESWVDHVTPEYAAAEPVDREDKPVRTAAVAQIRDS